MLGTPTNRFKTTLATFNEHVRKPDVLIRVLADALIITLCLFGGLVGQSIWLSEVERTPVEFNDLVAKYPASLIVAIVTAILVYSGSGIYTRSRGYRGRYKGLVIVQAVTLTYLVVGFLAYLFPAAPFMPRTALVMAWSLSLALTFGARLFSLMWLRFGLGFPHTVTERPAADVPNRVLVIGGAGYIGSALVPKLLARGYRVRLLDVFLYGREPLRSVFGHPNLEIVEADFRQVDRVVEAMQDVDAVVHLGAIVGDPACALNEGLTIEVNLIATRMIAEVAKGRGISRFIFASTCSVYGESEEILDELSSLNPVSLYAQSKIASEQVLNQMADDKFAPTILRFGTIFGLSGRTRFDLVVNLLTAKAMIEGQITVFGNDQWRPFVHVDDAAHAVLLSIEAPMHVVGREVFNVGSNSQNATLGQVGQLIQRLVPTAELISKPSDGDRRNYKVDFSRISNRLKYTPRWTIEEGVRQVMAAIHSGEVVDYKDAKYSNVKFLSEEATPSQFSPGDGWAYALIGNGNGSVAGNGKEPTPLRTPIK